MPHDNVQKDSLRLDRSALVAELSRAGGQGLEKRYIRCPFHNDRTPSAEIKQAASQAWYFYCHKCDLAHDVWALRAHIEGKDVGDVLKDARASTMPLSVPIAMSVPKTNPSYAKETPKFATIDDIIAFYRRLHPEIVVEGQYSYTDPDTKQVDLCIIRYRETPTSKKKFAQATPVDGGWVNKGISGATTPLYNRTRIRSAKRILVVEGEKCVHAVTELKIPDLAATTSVGGSSNAKRGDWSVLAGKECYVFADNDETGQKYYNDVITELKQYNCSIYRVRIEELGLGEGEDVVDYLASCE